MVVLDIGRVISGVDNLADPPLAVIWIGGHISGHILHLRKASIRIRLFHAAVIEISNC